MAKSWVNIYELRERVKNAAELIAREEGVEDPIVEVRIVQTRGKPVVRRVVEIEVHDRRDIGPREVEMHRGKKWEGN